MPGEKQKKIVPINYTNREFESIRRDLIGIAERYYPDTFRDPLLMERRRFLF